MIFLFELKSLYFFNSFKKIHEKTGEKINEFKKLIFATYIIEKTYIIDDSIIELSPKRTRNNNNKNHGNANNNNNKRSSSRAHNNSNNNNKSGNCNNNSNDRSRSNFRKSRVRHNSGFTPCRSYSNQRGLKNNLNRSESIYNNNNITRNTFNRNNQQP